MKRLFAWALGLGASLHAFSAGYTDEEWALVSRVLGSAHLAVSADEQWRLRVQGTQLLRELHRPLAANSVALDVGEAVLALAASSDARRAVVQTRDCIGLARFDSGGAPRLTWLGAPRSGGEASMPERCPNVANERRSFSVAMSPDGRRAAVPMGNELRLVDTETQRVLQRWPLGSATVLQLAFLDGGRELLVRAAVMGEVWEGPSDPSSLLIARWSTTQGELLDLWSRRDILSVREWMLPAAQSVGLSWLWQIEAERSDVDRKGASRAVARAVRECGMPLKAAVPLQGAVARWLDLAADPRGRWLAANDYEAGQYAAWWVWSTADGRRLAGEARRGAGESPVRALQASGDGSRLWGVAAGLPEGGRVDAEMWTAFHGGGSWVEHSVAGLSPAPQRASVGSGTCTVSAEGERSRAVREVKNVAVKPQRLFELPLEQKWTVDAQRERADRCVAENGWGGRAPPRWGLGADGTIWLDADEQVRRIDPSDGRTLAQLATPRSAQVCSAAIFSARQFLNWQGDTVTLRPFEAPAGDAGRRVVARRPGWVADAAIWLGAGRIAVRWKNPTAEIEAPGGAQGQLYVEQGGRFVPEGAAALGMVVSGGHVYLSGEDEGDDPMPANSGWLFSPQPPRYRWQAGPFGSLQAHRLQTSELALWLGMKAGARGDTGMALSLGGNLGLAYFDGGYAVFDAAKRERRLLVPGGWTRGAHLPEPGVLLVEWEDRLTAYRLSP